MLELQGTRVQSQSASGIRAGPVFVIADDRTFRIGQMHADLIAPARLWCQFDQRAGRDLLHHPVIGHRMACPLASVCRKIALNLDFAGIL